MDNIIKFINEQKETYKIELNLEIILGKSCNDFSFEELNLDEKTLNDIVKKFRNYKLSYSQGKIYKYGDLVIKTFNNKNTEIIKTKNIDNTKIIELIFNKAKEVIAGPGHKPIKPQPAPNKIEPTISFLSISLFVGIEKLDENNGLSFFLNK